MPRRAKPGRQLHHIMRSPCLLRQLVKPLQEIIRLSISEEKERSWFPKLPVLIHLLAGIYFQVAQMLSLRELVTVLQINQKKAGIEGLVPKRSTFSDANNSPRRLRIIRQVFATLVVSSEAVPRRWKGLKRLAALDSTLLHSVASAKWADYRKDVNACKGHILFDLARSIPKKLVFSTGRTHDRKPFLSFLQPGWTYIVDRAYNDYALFATIDELGAFIVTRMKVGSVYRIVKKHPVSRAQRQAGVLSDQTILLGSGPTQMTVPVRYIHFRADDGRIYHFITNRFDLSSTTIAQLYQARWAIEIFFKWLKRTLRMERPLGRSAYAYEIHILMTLITDILLKILSRLSSTKRHLPVEVLRFVREHLFSWPSNALLQQIIQKAQL
jgi:hypothetical protein